MYNEHLTLPADLHKLPLPQTYLHMFLPMIYHFIQTESHIMSKNY